MIITNITSEYLKADKTYLFAINNQAEILRNLWEAKYFNDHVLEKLPKEWMARA